MIKLGHQLHPPLSPPYWWVKISFKKGAHYEKLLVKSPFEKGDLRTGNWQDFMANAIVPPAGPVKDFHLHVAAPCRAH